MIKIKRSLLTKKQIEILKLMKVGEEYCVYDFNCHPLTLNTLEKFGLLTSRDESEKPFMVKIHRKFRLKDKIKIVVYDSETKTYT